MTDHTSQTLKHWRSVPFSYENGEDCLMSLADHVFRVTGVDYGKPWRGKYRTEREALAQIDKWNGAENIIDTSNLKRTDQPQRGDIILAEISEKQIGGIFTGDTVAFRLQRGVAEINHKLIKIIAAWRVK